MKKGLRFINIIGCLVLTFLFVVGCENKPQGANTNKNVEVIKIGAILPLTGDAAFYGESLRKLIFNISLRNLDTFIKIIKNF